MDSFINFFNSFVSYLLLFAIIVVLVIIACVIGVKWRKSKDLKKEQSEGIDGGALEQ